MKTNDGIHFLTFEQAQDLVERIADRTKVFNYTMSDNEKDAMAQLLSEVGVKTSSLIDVSYLADNYAINAEIVNAGYSNNYGQEALDDALFSWEEEDGTHYCIQW